MPPALALEKAWGDGHLPADKGGRLQDLSPTLIDDYRPMRRRWLSLSAQCRHQHLTLGASRPICNSLINWRHQTTPSAAAKRRP